MWLAVVPLLVCFWAQEGGAAYAATRPSASLGAGLNQVWKWLSGADGSGPRSQTGSAHDVRAAKAGKGRPAGKAPGKGKGQLATWKAPSTQAKKERSGNASVGFDAKTSKRVAAKSGAQFDYFQNADGSFTRKMSQSRINYRDSSGTWKSIDTAVTKTADDRWHEKANSLGVSFASSTGADGSVRQSALRGSGAGSVVPAALTWTTETKAASALQADATDDPTATPSPTVSSGTSAQGDLATLTLSDAGEGSWTVIHALRSTPRPASVRNAKEV
ncbi:hypothetical protein JHN63_09190 [Streptomyces sp. MBT65]|uniref:hypothetical protein n=1 Tax=Streptomyces sp. MBT65 TaxID=1488395 RepID=UPI00190B491F|nr:hypothetical protein [Streptomyces sp. MBT65]MBK3573991.1 hypothetical protein [Streptomyces sp. MBT65]